MTAYIRHNLIVHSHIFASITDMWIMAQFIKPQADACSTSRLVLACGSKGAHYSPATV